MEPRHLYLAYSSRTVAPAGRGTLRTGTRPRPGRPRRHRAPAPRVPVQPAGTGRALPRWNTVERVCWRISFRLRNFFSRLMRGVAPPPPAASATRRSRTAGPRAGRPLPARHLTLVKSDSGRKHLLEKPA